jgi:hypothetical protein
MLQIWLYKPIDLEEQAKQMLQVNNPLAALILTTRAAAANESWTDGAFAEVGYVLLHGTLQFSSIFSILLRTIYISCRYVYGKLNLQLFSPCFTIE